MSDDPKQHDPPGGLAFGGTIFLEQSAHVAILDAAGRIMAVNAAWDRFALDNGLARDYAFAGVDYLDVCDRAARARHSDRTEGAAAALTGLRDILDSRATRFSITYPCHAPHAQRWFLMYARPLSRGVGGAVVSHIDVTALKVAGLVPDETASARKPPPPSGASPSDFAADVATLESLCEAVAAAQHFG